MMSGVAGGIRFRCFHPLYYLRRRQLCGVSAAANKQKVIVISGPTGAGKSRLALELAKRLNGEIVSADSVQVYRGLDVGSAKPSLSDRKEVKHHLIDILEPSEDYSVGQFYEEARNATEKILESGRVPIVTGGTGLYLRWYIYGKPDVPKSSPEIVAEVQAEISDLERDGDWDAAVQLVVQAGDPSARSLPANDWYRIRRKLEIIKSSGSPPSAFHVPYDSFREPNSPNVDDHCSSSSLNNQPQESRSPGDLDYDFSCFFLSSPRMDLYRSIDFRCEDMVSGSDGILSEAKWLLDIGLQPNTNSATRAIGYRNAMEYLLHCKERGGSSTRDFYTFLSGFQKASRNFAKRQLTWFRNEPIYNWINASRPMEDVLKFIYESYHDQSGTMEVPKALQMKRDLSDRREILQMKGYRTNNRQFVGRDNCADILEWIRETQGQLNLSAS
ncbi:tRNA dimethylallyltransferase 9 [Apium graveolens]|uniref:tRNA dimethylallyltransferase 9 n=1 Tax=Apium graveolens TaxID=4045 RepID=UPI003D78FA51